MQKYIFISILFFSTFTNSITEFKNQVNCWPSFSNSYDVSPTQEMFNDLYKNALLLTNYSDKPRIPKIIHHIWLGSPLPKKYRILIKRWRKLHPDWEFKLWTDKEVEQLNLYNKVAYDSTTNYGMKSDIVRYEILYRYGGLYVDTDQEPVLAHDIFHHITDLYTGFLTTPNNNEEDYIANAVIGAKAGHLLLYNTINHISNSTNAILNIKNSHLGEIMSITGPIMFTLQIIQFLESQLDQEKELPFLALPKAFFYPLPVHPRPWITIPLKKIYTKDFTMPYTYGIQYHLTSWLIENHPQD